jgi:hypothetical protein
MFLKQSKPRSVSSSLLPKMPSLEVFLSDDLSFPSAYFRCLGSIAAADGTVNITEYEVLHETLLSAEQSALATLLILRAIEKPIALDEAFKQLKRASKEIDPSVTLAAFEAAKPLIELQGNKSRRIAEQLADSLEIQLSNADRDDFLLSSDRNLWQTIVQKSKRLLNDDELIKLGERCFSLSGNSIFASQLSSYETQELSSSDLLEAIETSLSDSIQKISYYESELKKAESAQSMSSQSVKVAEELYFQVSQRLANIEARLDFERRGLHEELDFIVHEAGQTFELEVQTRLMTDKWELPRVWEHIAKTSFAKELAFRIDAFCKRREESLQLLADELRMFQDSMRFFRVANLGHIHHSRLVKFAPRLRVSTRVLNAGDQVANATLFGSLLASAASGMGMYVWGAAATATFIAPAVPFIAGAAVTALTFKWLTDSKARLADEIQDKRRSFEKTLRQQLSATSTAFENELVNLEHSFKDTAESMVRPYLLEAQAAETISDVQTKLLKKLLKRSRASVTILNENIQVFKRLRNSTL